MTRLKYWQNISAYTYQKNSTAARPWVTIGSDTLPQRKEQRSHLWNHQDQDKHYENAFPVCGFPVCSGVCV